MATAVIGVIVLVALFFALRGVVRHWHGEGSCCGGGGEIVAPPKKTLTGDIVGEKIIEISGMTCGNCKIRVEQALDAIDGAAAEVNLHHNRATLKMTRKVSDDEIRQSLAGSGYEITAIRTK